jgi:hypothetical protein
LCFYFNTSSVTQGITEDIQLEKKIIRSCLFDCGDFMFNSLAVHFTEVGVGSAVVATHGQVDGLTDAHLGHAYTLPVMSLHHASGKRGKMRIIWNTVLCETTLASKNWKEKSNISE